MMSTLFYMVSFMTMAASQSTCGVTESFTVSSGTYPGSNGCYSYVGLTDQQDPLFSSQQQGGNSLVAISESVFDPNFDQYYLFFYDSAGETVFCASSSFAYKINHPVNIDEEGGWSFCYTGDGNQDVAIGEIDITCGCEEETVEPTAEPTVEPTAEPTVEPTAEPTVEPTAESIDSIDSIEYVDSDEDIDENISADAEKEIEEMEEMVESERVISSAYPLDFKYSSIGVTVVIGYIFSMMF